MSLKIPHLSNWPSPLELSQSLPGQPCILWSDKGIFYPTTHFVSFHHHPWCLSISDLVWYLMPLLRITLCIKFGGPSSVDSITFIPKVWSRGKCTLVLAFIFFQCLGSRNGNHDFPLTWFFSHLLDAISLLHNWESYTWWFSDLDICPKYSPVCVRCSRRHEGYIFR